MKTAKELGIGVQYMLRKHHFPFPIDLSEQVTQKDSAGKKLLE